MIRTPEQIERLNKRVDRWSKLSYDEQQRRLRVWSHNGMLGKVKRARITMEDVGRKESTSDNAKNLALRIDRLLEALDHDLRNYRIDSNDD